MIDEKSHYEELAQQVEYLTKEVERSVKAEKTLKESEKRYRKLFEQSNDAVFIHQSGRIADVNQAACDMLGYPKEQLVGMSVQDLQSKEDNITVENRIQYVSKGESIVFETEFLRSDGSMVPVEISSSIVDFGKEIIQGVVRDITSRKHAAEERTRLEIRLGQAQKMEALGTMAGGFAHDFNNILTPMILHAELLAMDAPIDSSQRFSIDEILSSGKRAGNLVKQIMTFSRQRIHKRINLRIGSIVKETLKLLRASLPSSISIQQNIKSETSEVLADPAHINQIIVNLCNNSADAMGANGGTICVALEDVNTCPDNSVDSQRLEFQTFLKLTVSDTGYGMESEVLDRIFDPYFTTKEKGEGSGMGLAMAHGIVTSYGGKIAVNSIPEKGTTVELYFPTIVKEDVPEYGKVAPLVGGKERILFLDDEDTVVRAIKPALERLGYNVVAESNSIEAIELFRREGRKFDMVLTDYTMPEMTGLVFAKEITSIHPEIPIVLCSGRGEIIDKEKARDAGVQEILSKPVILSEIASVIRRVFDNKSGMECGNG